MIRTLFILTVLFTCAIPTLAQEDIDTSALDGTPLAECGAIDYLLARHELNAAFYEVASPLMVEDTVESWADIYQHASIYRNGLLLLTPPECVKTLHDLTLSRLLNLMDAAALMFASQASFTRDTEFGVIAGRLLERYSSFDNDITQEMIDLGWLVPDENSPDEYIYAIEALNE